MSICVVSYWSDLAVKTALNGCGYCRTPTIGSVDGVGSLGGKVMVNVWRRLAKNRNNSVLVRLSPRHIRRPAK